MTDLEDRALRRLDILARSVERIGTADLTRLVVGSDPPGRDLLRERVRDAILAAGLERLRVEASERFRDWQMRLVGADQPGRSIAGIENRGSVTDRVDALRAVDDSVLAAVAADVISGDDYAILSEPLARIRQLRPTRR